MTPASFVESQLTAFSAATSTSRSRSTIDTDIGIGSGSGSDSDIGSGSGSDSGVMDDQKPTMSQNSPPRLETPASPPREAKASPGNEDESSFAERNPSARTSTAIASSSTASLTSTTTPWVTTGSVGSASFMAAATDLDTTSNASIAPTLFLQNQGLDGLEVMNDQPDDATLETYLSSFLDPIGEPTHLTDTKMESFVHPPPTDTEEEAEAKRGATGSSLWNHLASLSPPHGDCWTASCSSASSKSSSIPSASCVAMNCVGESCGRSSTSRSRINGPATTRHKRLKLVHPLVMPPKKNRALLWFRKDLRLHDNLALRSLLNDPVWLDTMTIIPIYVVHKPEHKRCNATRFQFLLECLEDLQKSLASKQSELIVLKGDALQVLPVIFSAWGITHLFFEEFVMPHGVERDFEVRQLAQASGVEVHSVQGVTLFDCKQVLERNDGQMPSTFDAFVKIVSEMPPPSMPLEAPQEIGHFQLSRELLLQELVQFAAHCDGNFNSTVVHEMAGVDDGSSSLHVPDIEAPTSVTSSSPEKVPFSVPDLQAFGVDPPLVHSFLFGGETRALQQLGSFCAKENRVASFDKPRTSPIVVTTPSTTCMSAYLNFGCLSPREFFYRVMCIQSKYPELKKPQEATLDGQLIWRDFFYCFGAGTPGFAFQATNPLCLQICWRLMNCPGEEEEEQEMGARAEGVHDDRNTRSAISPPTSMCRLARRSCSRSPSPSARSLCTPAVTAHGSRMTQAAASLLVNADTKLAMEQFRCWQEGRTGYPWIDAVMHQLVQEGWAHHLARHSVACFLTRGGLFIAWERGAEFFEEILIDYDLAINTGNWLWVSASSFCKDYRVVHSPTACAQQWDPQGIFIRKYIPSLRKLPTRFICEPWKAPLSVQRASGCLIGKDYPFPIVDFRTYVQRCLTWMDEAYTRQQYGNPASTTAASSSPPCSSSSSVGAGSASSTESPPITLIIPNGLFI